MKKIKYNLIEEVIIGKEEEPITSTEEEPVTGGEEPIVGTGEEPVTGTEEPIIEKRKGLPVEITCSEDVLESNLEMARKEAFEEPIVEPCELPDPEPSTDEIIDTLLGVTA